MIYGVRPWAVVVGLLLIVAAGLGAFLAFRPAGPPEPCHDTAEVSQVVDTHCPPGATLEIYPAGEVLGSARYLVKCVCPKARRVAVDAGENVP